MNIVIAMIVVVMVMALLLYAIPEAAAAGADRRPGGALDPEPRHRLLRGLVMRAARFLLAATLNLLAAEGCASVVIIQRSVPTLADQWRAGTTSGNTTVTVPKDARQPLAVSDH
jgi:hypothetical protein